MGDWDQNVFRTPALRRTMNNIFEGKTTITPALEDTTPVNGIASQGTMTIDGVVIDGETVLIGADTYEFCADSAQSVTTVGNLPIDISAVSTASEGKLSMATKPTATNTITIGTTVYTFRAAATVVGDVEIGADIAASKLALVAAINGTDELNSAHPDVMAPAFVGDTCDITALVGGVAGDSIATTETFTDGTDAFDAGTLGTEVAGADCVQAAAVTALALAITTFDTQGVAAADGAGDTVVLTADALGVAGNAITITETMANGAFDAVVMGTTTAGVDGTVGTAGMIVADGDYIYVCSADNSVAGANWTRAALTASY